MSEQLVYALGLLLFIAGAKFFARKIFAWCVKFFACLALLACPVCAQEDEEPPAVPLTDSQNLAVIADGVGAISLGLGIVVGMLTWSAISHRTRFDL